MRIDTGDNPPVKLKPYRTPLHKREIVNKAITDMLEANIIRRSNSNYSSPVVLVDKKDKTTRFCIDFRSLNSSTLAIRYPLPVIDDILTLLGAAKFYSFIDLWAGFWQIKMAEEDKSKTAFVCHKGLFEFQSYSDLKKPYVLYTDASNDTIGACLTQPCEEEETHLSCLRKEKPIYFLSHKLSDTQSRWSTIEKEAFKHSLCLQKLDHYLHGAEFIIRTDTQPLKYLLLSPQCIASYNCRIEWLAGTDNTIADYLSRRPPGQEGNQNQSETIEVDISDKAFQINTLNSNEFNPKDFASCDYKEDDQLSVKECTISGYDMKIEQSLDIELSEIINQINTDGSVAKKVHLEHLKKAKIDEWVIPTNLEGRQLRKTNYVVPPEDSDESDNELPVANPRERLINRYRQERETSSDEDDIPLAELKQKIANRNRRENEKDKSSVTSGSSEMSDNNSSDGYNSDRSQKMSVDEVIMPKDNKQTVKKSEKKDELILSFLSTVSCYLNKMHD
ncbi:Hypothetical predicted protein [Mytilus galloprovincialis]|uniref:Reverse transcriptase RNase H-like domain-containing protein n=1 Tax=Mytilus galloprovincialis TaxID=29158 RepID=A0A8B6CIF9_MYTGA|nr:Hypothetical predicted protein [Mytilus galloprovincialis]